VTRSLREVASLDFCIVLDCTGSMAPYLDVVKDHIEKVLEDLESIHPDVNLRLAFIGYRDHGDGCKNQEVFKFSRDVARFREVIGRQNATGGNDMPEDVMGALYQATMLRWKSSTRVLCHICDAPCHGTAYQEPGVIDFYPDGDPYGLTPEIILPRLRNMEIIYFFLNLSPVTNRMVGKFNDIMRVYVEGDMEYIRKISISDPSVMMTTVTEVLARTVSSALSTSTSVSIDTSSSFSSSARSSFKSINATPISPVNADLSKLEEHVVHVYEMVIPESITQITTAAATSSSGRDLNVLSTRYITQAVRISPDPFAAGAFKEAYMAEVRPCCTSHYVSPPESPPCSSKSSISSPLPVSPIENEFNICNTEHVLKRLKCGDNCRASYESGLSAHRVAVFLSRLFNDSKPPTFPAVVYHPVSLVCFTSKEGGFFATLEQRIRGDFEKYNTNSGWVPYGPTVRGTDHTVVQAFTHWTYVVTSGELLVVDCQGVFSQQDNSFYLTDPAVHCATSLLRFGGTNLGREGIARFLHTHKCTSCCEALGLDKIYHISVESVGG